MKKLFEMDLARCQKISRIIGVGKFRGLYINEGVLGKLRNRLGMIPDKNI